MVFTGTYEHTIDAKNRLAVPSEIRALFVRGAAADKSADEGDAVYLYVTLGEGQSLCLYTENGFNQRADELEKSELDQDQLLEYEQIKYSLSNKVEVDKQGRVRLPEHLLKRSGLAADVVLIGVKDHVEIRDRQAWAQHVEQKLAQHPRLLMNPRQAMKKTNPPLTPQGNE